MKTTTTGSLSLVLSAILFSAQLPAWAGPSRSDIADSDGFDGEAAQGWRLPLRALVSGQVLLDTSNFVATLVGFPPSPHIIPFRASLRVYVRRVSRGNEFVRTVTTDADGKFELLLPPGDYRIVPDIMQGARVVAPGDATDIILIGNFEAAPALDISIKRNHSLTHSLTVTINYVMMMGS